MITGVACLTLVVALVAQGPQPAGTLVVRLRAGDRPIASATVRAGERTEKADAGGRVTLTLAPGDHDLIIEADGFLPAAVHAVITAGATAEVDVEMQPLEEEIFVTATRTGTRLQDQPLRVEVIDREEIEEKALMTPGSVAMLLGETTGLRVQTTAPSLGAANVRIQGLRGHYSQLVADGLPLYGAQGDSFSLLQVPPLDLGQVEVIKGVASALYGASALGGVINLVSRRPRETEYEALFNVTTLGGADATVFLAQAPGSSWSWTLLGGYHGQARQDLDDDGWTDVAGYDRGVVRPRVFFDNGRGATVFATGGVMLEDREGGTAIGGVAPDGRPFTEALATRAGDGGIVGRWVTEGGRIASARGSFMARSQDRWFGDVRERGVRRTWFGEASLSGISGRHTWVVGAAFQRDRYAARDLPQFDYVYSSPAAFAQDEIALGPKASLAASARVDVHSEYGTLASPRVSLLARPGPGWTLRVSGGTGAFTPTPFTEETDETGFSRLLPLAGLDAERAWGASADVTYAAGPFELTATGFGSVVNDPTQLATVDPDTVALVNAGGPTRTWGTELIARYRREGLLAMVTHAWTRSTELDVDEAIRREVPLTPRHTLSLNVVWDGESWGRFGIETYYIGRQALEDDPYRESSRPHALVGFLGERRLGRVRVFLNAENVFNVRQTRWDPLVRPARRPDGRWTVDAWAPLDGRVFNGGVRVEW